MSSRFTQSGSGQWGTSELTDNTEVLVVADPIFICTLVYSKRGRVAELSSCLDAQIGDRHEFQFHDPDIWRIG